jgi:hypothetical protein
VGRGTEVRPEIAELFRRYDEAGTHADASAAEYFAASFLALDPEHALTLDRATLAGILPGRRQAFEELGVRGLRLAELTEEPLDERHTLARTTWRVEWSQAGPPTEVSASYVLRREDAGWQIVVYLNNHDVMAMLASRGHHPS